MKTIKTFNSVTAAMDLGPGKNKIMLPPRAQVLAVTSGPVGVLLVSVAANPDERATEERTLWVIKNGAQILTGAGRVTYLGSSAAASHHLWHVFEVDSPEDGPRKAASLRGASIVNRQSGPIHGNSMQVGMVTGAIRHTDSGMCV